MTELLLDPVDTQNALELHQSGSSSTDNIGIGGDDAEVGLALRDDKNNSLKPFQFKENGTSEHPDATSGHAELDIGDNVPGHYDVTGQNCIATVATVSPDLFRYRCGLYPYQPVHTDMEEQLVNLLLLPIHLILILSFSFFLSFVSFLFP